MKESETQGRAVSDFYIKNLSRRQQIAEILEILEFCRYVRRMLGRYCWQINAIGTELAKEGALNRRIAIHDLFSVVS